MTKSITIRDVPEATRDELAARAASTGRSLQEYLRAHLIELASRPEPAALLARIRERKARTATKLSAKQILAHRTRVGAPPTSYDAWNVALTETLETRLATVDVKLSRAAGPRCGFILPRRPR